MSDKKQPIVRFSIAQRLEHFILILSFTTLGVTGLPQKYALSPISQAVISALGGIESIRVIHRIAATIFLVEAIYHLVVVGYKLYVRRQEASMVPGVKDGQDFLQAFLYNLGLRKDAPKMPRYNFAEKMEYWAMLWGLFVMAATGFMLWNPIATTSILPGELIPASKVAHGGEAVLAVLAIILWHFWSVHLKFFNKSMFTGKIDRHEMEEDHAMELERIESGLKPAPVTPEAARQRMNLFVPAAVVISLALLGAVYWFVTFEKTSITTIPPAEQARIFVPQTPTPVPPTPTPAPTATPGPSSAIFWSGDIETILADECSACHGDSGGFSAATYADVMKEVKAGDPDGSNLVEVQKSSHPGQLSSDELTRVIEWIKTGAPETAGGSSSPGGSNSSAELTWSGKVSGLFSANCAACHGSAGGFSAESYDGVMQKITAGSPETSDLVKIQQAGDHPGTFSAEDLQTVIDWIKAGAPQ